MSSEARSAENASWEAGISEPAPTEAGSAEPASGSAEQAPAHTKPAEDSRSYRGNGCAGLKFQHLGVSLSGGVEDAEGVRGVGGVLGGVGGVDDAESADACFLSSFTRASNAASGIPAHNNNTRRQNLEPRQSRTYQDAGQCRRCTCAHAPPFCTAAQDMAYCFLLTSRLSYLLEAEFTFKPIREHQRHHRARAAEAQPRDNLAEVGLHILVIPILLQ